MSVKYFMIWTWLMMDSPWPWWWQRTLVDQLIQSSCDAPDHWPLTTVTLDYISNLTELFVMVWLISVECWLRQLSPATDHSGVVLISVFLCHTRTLHSPTISSTSHIATQVFNNCTQCRLCALKTCYINSSFAGACFIRTKKIWRHFPFYINLWGLLVKKYWCKL